RVYGELRKAFPEKEIYTTEATGWRESSNTEWKGSCNWGLKHNWLDGLTAGASVGMQWNLVLDDKYGPTTRKDSLAVGLVTVNTDSWDSAMFEREFYCMAQVSMAVRPGSVRIGHSIKPGGSNISALAVERSDESVALVVSNQNKKPRVVEVRYRGDRLKLSLKGNSVQTIIW
ncbi:MAG: glycoside hydrolase family 30 beta sandwich domain-containing protein, partial [Verrucomicrobiota bacterium]